MHKKLIVAAVGAAIAPLGAQADAALYGRINNAIDYDARVDDGDTNTDISGVASRIGVKYSGDIGGGFTARGRYEFATTTDKEGPGINDTRIATVGLSGDFGTVDIGNQWSAYFNTFGTLVSPTYSLGYYLYSSVGGGPFRASNTIKYSNSFGPLYVELDARLNDSNEPSADAEKIRGNGWGFGATFSPSDQLTVALSADSEQGADGAASDMVADGPDTDRFGVAVKFKLGGGMAIQGGHQNYTVDDDPTKDGDDETEVKTQFVWLSGSAGAKTSWLAGYSQADLGVDGNDDPTQITLGLYHNMGGGLKLYYESATLEHEGNNWDGTRHLFGMRVDF